MLSSSSKKIQSKDSGTYDDDSDNDTTTTDNSGIELKPLVSPAADDVTDDDLIDDFIADPAKEDDHVHAHSSQHNGQFGSAGTHSEFGEIGTASNRQVAINIFISFVGAGMLGMPYAFAQSGWLLGSITLAIVSTLNVYAMLLLVQIRNKLESLHGLKGDTINGYGDVGRYVIGINGEKFVNLCLVISQVGFGTAYIIFIAANLTNIFTNSSFFINRAIVCFGCMPILSLLVQIRNMKKLSPFSLIADVANLVGLSAVLLQDIEFYHHELVNLINWNGLLYVASVSIYSLEGIGLILPLESSCKNRKDFPWLLKVCVAGITLLMIVFGTAGYLAFGHETQAPITLNLMGEWATFVKLALCLALYLTYPIMLFPVHHVLEDMMFTTTTTTTTTKTSATTTTATTTTNVVSKSKSCTCRILIVLFSSTIAYTIPDFGKFLSLVGSSICMLLGFILPGYFHLKVFQYNEMKLHEYFLDYVLIIFGCTFGILGTINSIKDLFFN